MNWPEVSQSSGPLDGKLGTHLASAHIRKIHREILEVRGKMDMDMVSLLLLRLTLRVIGFLSASARFILRHGAGLRSELFLCSSRGVFVLLSTGLTTSVITSRTNMSKLAVRFVATSSGLPV